MRWACGWALLLSARLHSCVCVCDWMSSSHVRSPIHDPTAASGACGRSYRRGRRCRTTRATSASTYVAPLATYLLSLASFTFDAPPTSPTQPTAAPPPKTHLGLLHAAQDVARGGRVPHAGGVRAGVGHPGVRAAAAGAGGPELGQEPRGGRDVDAQGPLLSVRCIVCTWVCTDRGSNSHAVCAVLCCAAGEGDARGARRQAGGPGGAAEPQWGAAHGHADVPDAHAHPLHGQALHAARPRHPHGRLGAPDPLQQGTCMHR